MNPIDYQIKNCAYPFSFARQHFRAVAKESTWNGKVVHVIMGVLNSLFPVNYIIALFERLVARRYRASPAPNVAPPPPASSPKSKPASEEIILGIDLGTTNSCVAFVKNGKAEVIADLKGARTTPSLISYGKELLHSTKRFMGCQYQEVTKDIQAVPYKVIQDENGKALFEVNGKKVRPEEAGAQVLLKMKQIAEAHLGKKIHKAVVTVPAYFNDSQRQATREAGSIAGLDVVKILAEPTAAAIAYGVDKEKENQKVAVYDLGGGTFDVSVLTLSDGIFEVLATNGDTHLGGDDFDQAIVRWMVTEHQKQTGTDLSKDKKKLEILRDAAIKAKIELTTLETTQIQIPTLNFSMALTRVKLEELCSSLIQRSVEPCRKALADASTKSKQKIDQVILVGGMTRMPAVQRKVKEIFGMQPNTSVNPDEAVALGAALQAGAINGDIDNVLLIDVTPLTLGIETEGGITTSLIDRNTSIPVSKTVIVTNTVDNQSSVLIQVVQGERKMSKDNKLIAQFELTGLPPAPRGTLQIAISFNLNGDGILEVSAREKTTGKKQQVRVQSKSGLSKEDVQRNIREAQNHHSEDALQENAAKIRSHAKTLISQVQTSINQKSLPSSPAIQQSIDALNQALKGEDLSLIEAKSESLLQEYRKAFLTPAA